MASELMQQLFQTVDYIKTQYSETPQIAIILGSGLGNFTSELKIEKEIDYAAIPHFPVSTVVGHTGKLIFGELSGKKVVVMSGRFHFYEGYSPQQVTYPIRMLKLLGVQTLLLSNAAGAVNKSFRVGHLMIITDHISFFTVNPLLGKNEDELGTRFPDMSEPYNRSLIAKATAIGERYNYNIKKGVYVAVTGPTFETHAEYKLILAIGGDAVGMSTVQETIVARHAQMNVFAISVITDIGIREDDTIITHEEVLAAAKEAEPKLTNIFRSLICRIVDFVFLIIKAMPQTCKIFIFLSLFICSCFQHTNAQTPQKIIAECTIVYSVNSGENNSGKTIKKLYIKGRKTRSEISNPAFYQATIFDNKTGDAVVLKEIGGDKYISSFNAEQWKEKNKEWADVSVKLTQRNKNNFILHLPQSNYNNE